LRTESVWQAESARAIIDELKELKGATMPILHALQEEFGYVHDEAVPLIADALNLSQAEVFGTLTYYHDFRREPAGRHVLKVCRAEACQSVGCEALVDHLKDAHGIAMGSTTSDRMLTVETVYCLGNCALGPSLMLDGEVIGRADAGIIDDLVDAAHNGAVGEAV